MLYLYAVIDGNDRGQVGMVGLEDAPLVNLVYRDLAAVVSPLEKAEVAPAEAHLWRHEAVVEALMAEHAVLPVRFGTLLADEVAVQTVLAAHYADFSAVLGRVRGRVELGLRVLWENIHRPREKGSGRAYLLARLQEKREAEALAEQVHAPLTQLSAESTRQVLTTPRLLLTASYLVEQDQVAAFAQEVEVLARVYPALRFLCTGPWPPYSFVVDCVPMTLLNLREEANGSF